MKLEDLQIGTLVQIIDLTFLNDNFDEVNGGYICKKTKKFLSSDMKTALIQKKLAVQAIDAEDPILNVKINGFWIPSLWIAKLAPKPKVTKRRASSVASHAADGKAYGTVFKALLNKFPDIGVLSTNRFSALTDDELALICNKLEITNAGNKIEVARSVMEAVMEFIPKAE